MRFDRKGRERIPDSPRGPHPGKGSYRRRAEPYMTYGACFGTILGCFAAYAIPAGPWAVQTCGACGAQAVGAGMFGYMGCFGGAFLGRQSHCLCECLCLPPLRQAQMALQRGFGRERAKTGSSGRSSHGRGVDVVPVLSGTNQVEGGGPRQAVEQGPTFLSGRSQTYSQGY